MSKENKQTISKQLAKCPFCNEELEVHCTSRYYMHKLNGCILQHFCFETDDELSIDLWNTRKPMERIVERFKRNMIEADGSMLTEIHNNHYKRAIEIVKEEGDPND